MNVQKGCTALGFVFTTPVQRAFTSGSPEFLSLSSAIIPLHITRNPRARRYLLRLKSDRSAHLTIPRGGSMVEARSFLERNLEWLEKTAQRLSARPQLPTEWVIGTEIYWRGEQTVIQAAPDSSLDWVRFG